MDKEEVINTHALTYTHAGILLNHKKSEILPFAATWMDIKSIILSEIKQRMTNIVWFNVYVESKNYNKLVNIPKKEADPQIERTK